MTTIVAEISCSRNLHTSKFKLPRETFLYHKTNWDLIRERILEVCERHFELNFSTQRTEDENWKFICENCLKVVQELVPNKTIGGKCYLPWINNALKRLIKKKQRTYNRAKKYKRVEDWNEYRNLQHQTKSLIHQQHNQYLLSSPKWWQQNETFWHCIKGKHQDNFGIGTLKNQSGSIVTDPSEKADISVFTIEDTTSIPDKGISPYPSNTDIDITVNGVRSLLENFDTNKSPGPDNMHAAFLKHVAFEIVPLLTHLYQQSIRNGTVPVSWKQPNITPIYIQERW